MKGNLMYRYGIFDKTLTLTYVKLSLKMLQKLFLQRQINEKRLLNAFYDISGKP